MERFSASAFRIARFSSVGGVQKPIRPILSSSRRTSPVVSTSPRIFSAYAGAGLGRRSSIRLRIFQSWCLDTATSASWQGDIATIADDLGADLDELFVQRGQQPRNDLLMQRLCPVLMQWTAPTTGIAMCQSAVGSEERRESPLESPFVQVSRTPWTCHSWSCAAVAGVREAPRHEIAGSLSGGAG